MTGESHRLQLLFMRRSLSICCTERQSHQPLVSRLPCPPTLDPPAESAPQLSNFDGISTQGVWTARVSDQYAQDIGTWQGWSLIITPRAFTCTPFTPANVSVSGRVLTAQGRGLASITVTMTDASGNRRSTLTNPFGFYGFTDVSAPGTYTLAVISRRFQFDPQVISVTGDVTGVNFTAQTP